MFCSECGNTIKDDALICPKCGAVTKNGIMALKKQESADQQNGENESPLALDLDDEKKSKTTKSVAMIFGLLGSVVLLLSLLSDFGSITAPIVGTVSVSMLEHLDMLLFFVIALALLNVLSSILKYAILQILSGSITAVWAIYMIWKIQSTITEQDSTGLVSVKIGVGIYLFVIAACLILASGFISLSANKNAKATIDGKGAK